FVVVGAAGECGWVGVVVRVFVQFVVVVGAVVMLARAVPGFMGVAVVVALTVVVGVTWDWRRVGVVVLVLVQIVIVVRAVVMLARAVPASRSVAVVRAVAVVVGGRRGGRGG